LEERRGRVSFLEEEDLQQLHREIEARALSLNAYTPATMKQRIKEKARESLERRGLNPDKAADMSYTCISEYMKRIGPIKKSGASIQNQRRKEVNTTHAYTRIHTEHIQYIHAVRYLTLMVTYLPTA